MTAQHHPTATPAAPLARRRFISLVGGGAVLAALGPGVGACSSNLPAASTQAWEPSDAPDPRRFMLANALLAPNPHNRQPWRADLRQEGEIALVLDDQRLLPETDPFGRQILVGCGAFIELAVIAAAERGLAVEVLPFPDGAPPMDRLPAGHTVARLRLRSAADQRPDPLFAEIRRRRTNKGAYDSSRTLPSAQWLQLTQAAQPLGLLAGHISAPEAMARVRALTRASHDIEITTPRTWLESARLLRIGPGEIAQHRDGISINGLMPRLLDGLGLFDRHAVPVRGDSNFQRMVDRWQPMETGSGYLWIAAPAATRAMQVNAGRAYARMQLQATAAGLAMHPLSQALQEFAEVRAQYLGMHQLLGLDAGTTPLQMLARVGYADSAVGPSPRRPMDALLRA